MVKEGLGREGRDGESDGGGRGADLGGEGEGAAASPLFI